MVYKIAVDAGHGYYTSGKRTPDGEREWSFNDKVVRAFIAEMSKYEDVEIRRYDDPTGKTDVPLSKRTGQANTWGADVYLSFHHNANTGKWGSWTGVQTHVYKTRPAGSTRLAKLVQPAIVKAYGLQDRGIIYNNLHITRETHMDSVLIEGGFMDSTIDIKKLRNDSVLKNAGIGIAQAVATFGGLKRKATVSVPQPSEKPVAQAGEPVSVKDVKVYPFVRLTGDVWMHKTPDFDISSRLKVLKAGDVYKNYGSENGLIAIGGGFVSEKYTEATNLVAETTTDLWTHLVPDFEEESRGQILKAGTAWKIYGETSNGMYVVGAEYASKKYMNLVSSS
jgi:N-acetylmuramoyl-L-alanine amidase